MGTHSYFFKWCKRSLAMFCALLIMVCSYFAGFCGLRPHKSFTWEHTNQIVVNYNTQPAYVKMPVNDLANFRKAQCAARGVNDKALV